MVLVLIFLVYVFDVDKSTHKFDTELEPTIFQSWQHV